VAQHLITTAGEDLLKIKEVIASSQQQAGELQEAAGGDETRATAEADPGGSGTMMTVAASDKGKERESPTGSPKVEQLKSSTGKKGSQGRTSPKASAKGMRGSDEPKPDKRRFAFFSLSFLFFLFWIC
jgi:hypothetical protein